LDESFDPEPVSALATVGGVGQAIYFEGLAEGT
jgi:hypothetical protein